MNGFLDALSKLQPVATLAAALVAAVAAVLTLVLTTIFTRGAEARVAQRKVVEPYLEALSQARHQVLATSTIMRRAAQNGADPRSWLNRSHQAKTEMGALRVKLRYVLPGLDESFRVLGLIPDWMSHIRARADDRPERLLSAANELAVAVDRCVLRVAVRGRQPSSRDLRRVRAKVANLKAVQAEGPDGLDVDP